MEEISYKIERPQEDHDTNDSTSSSESGEQSLEDACFSPCMDETMFPPRQKLPESVVAKFSGVARNLAVATLLCNLVITGFGFFTSTESDSMATFGFAFDSFFAVIASFVLIWRFWQNNPDNAVVVKREKNATTVVAVCLVVSSVAIIVRSILCLYQSDKPEKPVELVILTSASVFVYSILFLAKRMVARKLGSGALMTDAMDSLCGALFAISILISALVLEYTEKAWFLDSSIAIVVAICSFVYGVVVIQKLLCFHARREESAALVEEYGYDILEQEKPSKEE